MSPAASIPLQILLPALAGLGLAVGSFLNVVIHRLPLMLEQQWLTALHEAEPTEAALPARRLTLFWPPSQCPHCAQPVRPWQNIPLLSYLLLRGRCGHCRAPISARYPMVELACGLGFGLLAALVPQSPGTLALASVLTAALLALAVIDLEQRLLPDVIVLPLLWLGLLANLHGRFVSLPEAVLGAVAGYGVLWMVSRLYRLLRDRDGMGEGDLKLLAALGAWFGWQMLAPMLLLASLGALVTLAVLWPTGRAARFEHVPFGTFLGAAGWICLLMQLIGR
ncbi:Leader peptidase / N-methyltransferase [Rhodovastum atsumiense]|nr:A24 family peptidase [Rhodovastum atsumiense]CAH2602652.1 Leader peptidase / N-methyltransferase [Rhodovastum atsumiense]